MEQDLIKAFDSLVPLDQTVIAGVIIGLYEKEKQVREAHAAVREMLGKAKEKKEPEKPSCES